MQNRIWELDLIKGVAICGVVFYHVAFDLQNIYNWNLGSNWEWISNFAFIFILVSGISSSFSRNNLSRGLRLGFIAVCLTVITYFYDPSCFIQFGILHLISFCIILYHFTLKKVGNIALLILGSIIICIGIWFSFIVSPFPHLYILGLQDSNYVALDYFPIFPWTGFFMLGIIFARTVYKDKKSIFKIKNMTGLRPICYLGRYSLLIYLVHQPILFMAFSLAFSKKIW